MSAVDANELAVLGAISAAQRPLPPYELGRILATAGIVPESVAGVVGELRARGHLLERPQGLEMSSAGVSRLLELHSTLEAALDLSPRSPQQQDCPTIPWLTTVQTVWIDALSLNYAVDPRALSQILPAPLEPEVLKGSAWVQVLLSSLRDMRPIGMPSLFGVCFYQASYRAAICYRSADGSLRRGGYFVRSETNHPVMRGIGNALAEFKFHDFGAAEMVMVRQGDHLSVGVDPETSRPGGRVVGIFDTRRLPGPPPESSWKSLDELHQPLVECYDALGVDPDAGYLYILTIDRDPWNAQFVRPEQIYCEYFATGPLSAGARLDSVLHLTECRYRWRPLRRERLSSPSL